MQTEYFYQLLNIELLSNDPKTKPVFRIFLFPIKESLCYKAGQYIEIQYPDGSFHPFSIANAPHPDGRLELLIKAYDEDASLHEFLNHLSLKRSAKLLGPFGNCSFEKLLHHPCLLLSGGVGISQSKAVIEQLISNQHQAPIHLYWGVQDPSSIFLKEIFIQWKQLQPQYQSTFVFFESQPILNADEKNGYLLEAVMEDYASLENYRVLASGPKEMVLSFRTFCQLGLNEKHLYSDWFDLL